ncbi:hypothetical protein Acr_28g0004030 [Actinidia rufa]|uniref:RNI-like superfamily protein n=1 Tax=Actinidia rufa TaxID=165716 RepID=A0A7J0H9K7_9ERIC|nr:hypothetical protein Acr_28g0004030 [Actinidia rufa]
MALYSRSIAPSMPLTQEFLQKYKFVSAIDALRKLRDDPNSQMLDIRDKRSLQYLGLPNLKIVNKGVVQVEFSQGDEEALKEIFSHFIHGFRELNYVDFSTSYSITGAFLKNLGGNGNQLEVLILRDCMHLKEVEVAKFLTAVIAGDFKLLRHLDISNREGLASEGDWYHRCYSTSVIPVKQLLDERPGFCLLAEFPDEGSFSEIEQMVVSEAYSDFSLPSQPSSHTSDGTLFMSSSESSYNSDQGSGNEDCREPDNKDDASTELRLRWGGESSGLWAVVVRISSHYSKALAGHEGQRHVNSATTWYV